MIARSLKIKIEKKDKKYSVSAPWLSSPIICDTWEEGYREATKKHNDEP